MSYDFANLEVLNLTTKDSVTSSIPKFAGSKKGFQRFKNEDDDKMTDLSGLLNGVNESDQENKTEEKISIGMLKLFADKITYTTIYHFDKKIKSVSNPNSKISADGKTVEMTFSLLDEEKVDLSNKIVLKGGLFK